MTLEGLKGLIIEQAREKGWGTTPETVKVYEKIVALCSEVHEAGQVDRLMRSTLDQGLQEVSSWAFSRRKGTFQYLASHCKTQAERDAVNAQLLERFTGILPVCRSVNQYARLQDEEIGDILMRVLHLGGCFGLIFPEPKENSSLYRKIRDLKDFEAVRTFLYDQTMQTARGYSKMSQKPRFGVMFYGGLVRLAQSVSILCEKYHLNAEQLIKDKLEKNSRRQSFSFNTETASLSSS